MIAKRIKSQKLGVSCTSNDKCKIFNKSVTFYKENGDILAILIKNAITDPKLIAAGRDLLRYKATTTNRGDAAGKKKETNYQTKSFGNANSVTSSIVGFTERHGYYTKCRQTMLYINNYNAFQNTTIKLIEWVSKQFAHFAPKQYKKQDNFITSINQKMRLGNTVYTTITVNVDFRTKAHKDKGDFSSGLGNLLVFNVGNFTGGELLLPEYNIGFNVQEGDLLLFDVHEVHCNNPIKGHGRISLVCYAREGIKDKCTSVTKAQLIANSSNKHLQHKKNTTNKDYFK